MFSLKESSLLEKPAVVCDMNFPAPMYVVTEEPEEYGEKVDSE